MRRSALITVLAVALAASVGSAAATTGVHHKAKAKAHHAVVHKAVKAKAKAKPKVTAKPKPKPAPLKTVAAAVAAAKPSASPTPSKTPSAAPTSAKPSPTATATSAKPSAPATATPAQTSSAAAGAYTDPITMSNGQLSLHGKPYEFTGVDAYGIATWWADNAGCDTQVSDSDMDTLFSSLRPDSLVRVWAFQGMNVNPNTKQLDWTGLDRVVNEAQKYHQRLILTLGDQAGTCDNGHFNDVYWYQGDDSKIFNDDGRGLNIMSYTDWVTTVVSRYAGNPAVGMWEPMNEAEDPTCDAGYTGTGCYGHDDCIGGTSEVLRDWFTTIGTQIKKLDPTHLVAAGLMGMGECGQQNEYYDWIAQSSGVDVMTIHDYDGSGQWDGALNDRWQRAQNAGKPIILEEWGTNASDSSGQNGCDNRADRASILSQKLDNGFAHTGFAGMLVWHWEPGGTDCSTEVIPGDPALGVLHDHAL